MWREVWTTFPSYFFIYLFLSGCPAACYHPQIFLFASVVEMTLSLWTKFPRVLGSFS